MTEDLVTFLRARLDEDERAARESTWFAGSIIGETWRLSGSHTDEGGTYRSITADTLVDGQEQTIEVVGSGINGGGVHTEEVARHIVRHDPARVLAEVEAKREVLRLAECAYHCHETSMNDFAAAMEGALRLFARAYAGHPDYRSEWRP